MTEFKEETIEEDPLSLSPMDQDPLEVNEEHLLKKNMIEDDKSIGLVKEELVVEDCDLETKVGIDDDMH